MLAIGRVYDERLEFQDFNFGIIFSVVYLFSAIIMFFSIKKIILTKTKLIFYFFYLLAVIMTPTLWMIFDISSYSIEKAVNFWLIVIPLSIIFAEKYNQKSVLRTFYILLGVSIF